MELCVHVKCSTKEQHEKLLSLCSERGFFIDMEQSWSSWVAETRTQEQKVKPDLEKCCGNMRIGPGGPFPWSEYMDFPQPRLRVVKTVGGFFRVYIHGPDSLQDNETFAVLDIGRGPTKEAAIAQAQEWFDRMADETPNNQVEKDG